MAQVVVEMTSEESKLWAGQQKAAKGFADMEAAAKKAAREHTEIERAAKRLYDSTRTPQERYNQQLAQANKLLQAGKIDQETYGRAARKAKEEMQASGSAGSGALGQIAGAAKLAVAGLNLIIQGYREITAAAKEAGQTQQASSGSLGMLAQMAQSPQEMQDLVGKARQFYAAGAATSMDEAARQVYDIGSAGAMADIDLYRELRGVGAIKDAGEMAAAIKALQTTMGTAETGNARALASKGFAAYSAYGTTEQVLAAAAKSGAAAGMIGTVSDEEVLAATAMLATAAKSAEEGGTKVNSLMRSLAKKVEGKEDTGEYDAEVGLGRGTGGQVLQAASLPDMIRQIEGMNMTNAELFKYFGRQEAVQAYDAIRRNMAEFQSTSAFIGQAEATDQTGQKLKFYESVPELQAARAARMGKAKQELMSDDLGRWSNLADAAQMELQGRVRKSGMWGGLAAPFQSWADYTERLGGNDEGYLRNMYEKGIIQDLQIKAAVEMQLKAADAQREAAREMKEAAEAQKAASRGPTMSPPNRDK